ncbi:MAG TPA: sugar ABC transporter ATP-binding protein [Sphingomonas sp.]|nr:sugar ABC transporter ATP-binding protein [Sphingomonas sp.]
MLRAEGIGKRYGGVVALDGVDFAVRPHSVHALIGENGAGKSTLMRILAGVEQPSSGRLTFDGAPIRFTSVRDAASKGIGIVFQELNLCPNLTVAENIFLGRSLRRGIATPRAAERERTRALLDRLGARIEPDTILGTLRIGQQQIVEIARALSEDVRYLIMDEPTSALSAAEVETLHRIVADLRDAGTGIVYISHRLEELCRVGDEVTVLRDGRLVETAPMAGVSVGWIVERMLGETGIVERASQRVPAGDVVLEFDDLATPRSGGAAVHGVTAAFRAGEITAIYGLLGAGRTELLEAACGARASTGAVRLGGEALQGLDLSARVERGLFLVPEDRQGEGIFQNLDIGGNLALGALAGISRAGIVSRRRERDTTRAMMARMGVKAGSPATPITALSGGNQQKVVIGRALISDPRALLLDEPSRGIDVGARAEIFETMRGLAAAGLAVVFTTSDVVEALAIADRVLVMADGRITADLDADDASEEQLVRAANPAPASLQTETI